MMMDDNMMKAVLKKTKMDEGMMDDGMKMAMEKVWTDGAELAKMMQEKGMDENQIMDAMKGMAEMMMDKDMMKDMM